MACEEASEVCMWEVSQSSVRLPVRKEFLEAGYVRKMILDGCCGGIFAGDGEEFEGV